LAKRRRKGDEQEFDSTGSAGFHRQPDSYCFHGAVRGGIHGSRGKCPAGKRGANRHVGHILAGWLALALFMLVYHVKNLRRPGSMPLFEVELEAGPGGGAAEISPARKLRDLEQLKKDGLINQEEYSQKRAEIMAENW
jgi:hypothetical protein